MGFAGGYILEFNQNLSSAMRILASMTIGGAQWDREAGMQPKSFHSKQKI